jgi:hypothetical protein
VQFSRKYDSLRITAETITSEVGISFATVLQTVPSFQVAGSWANFVYFPESFPKVLSVFLNTYFELSSCFANIAPTAFTGDTLLHI